MTSHTDWRQLLANPGPRDHIAQLYQDEQFYGEAISHFAAEGLVRGEAVILVATHTNWLIISAHLRNKGFNLHELFERGQLTLVDAEDSLSRIMVESMPDARVFKRLARATILRARAGGKYRVVRWWGEMVNIVYQSGNKKASMKMEEYCEELVNEESIAMFCSYLMDKYDPQIYHESLVNVCRTHSHLIPTDNYSAHRHAVNHAVAEVLGPIKGPLLHSLVSWKGAHPGIPLSQAILMWVKDTMPHHLGDVLTMTEQYDCAVEPSGNSR